MPQSRSVLFLKSVAVGLLTICVGTVSFVQAQSYESSPVAAALKKADLAVERIVALDDSKRTFDNTVGAIDDLIVRLRLDTEFLQFMAYVSPNADLRDSGQTAEEDVRNWLIALMKREDLYRAVKAYADTKPKLAGREQKRLLEHTIRDYRRAGMELNKEHREKLKSLQMQLNKLSIEFEKNIREDETRVLLSKGELKGLPEDWFKTQPVSNGLYLVGMDYPSFLPIMDHCEVELTRQKVWTAYKRRGGKRNVKILERILKLRAQAAGLLGYQHTADYETEIRMAKSAAEVLKFYSKLRPLLRKKAKLDWQEFTAAKRRHTNNPRAKLYPWDQSFYEKWLMKEKYAVDSEKVRAYFPMQRVIDGLFTITQSLYGLKYKDVTKQASGHKRPIWHPDVRLYEVFDNATGDVLGEFYLDLHPRPHKYGHAAQWGLFPRKVWKDGSVQKPLVALVCNFTKPTADKPSLLSHDEVETFFHEFGHCLHSILTEAQYGEFSGTAVSRDFVEAPSQMFENWVWDATVLKTFARHYKTGEFFPDDLLAGMIKARFLGSGMKAEHQVFYGLVDMTYHTAPGGNVDTTQVGLDLFQDVELYDAVPNTYFQAAFGHLTGYQAGYYGYLWSLVYAQDMLQRFKELGMLSPKAGMDYRKKILSRGGTLDELDMVRDYLGREPRMEPFLRHLGLLNKQGFVSLSGGKNLDGWLTGPDNRWVVEGGVIALKRNFDGNLHNADYLWTKDQYGDFILDLEFKVPERANSGIFLRTSDLKAPVYTGIEVQVANSYGQKTLSRGGTAGAIYDCLAPTENVIKRPGQWNRYIITCKGPKLTVVLNGRQIIDMDLDRWREPHRNPDGSKNKFGTALKDFARKGHVGLQDHGRPVWYRNIRIKRLD